MTATAAGTGPVHEPALHGWVPDAPADGFDPPAPLRSDDLDRVWQLDFHYPAGTVPLGVGLVADLTLASQRAARDLGLGPESGLAARLVGPHVYLGPARQPVGSPLREDRVQAETDRYPERFRAEWARLAAELDAEHQRLQAVPLQELDRTGLTGFLADARAVHRRAWDVHFAVMYRLLAVQAGFLAVCREVGVSDRDAALALAGEPSRVSETDRALRQLEDEARRLGVADVLVAVEPHAAQIALAGTRAGRQWWGRLEELVQAHGQRCGALGDLTMASWEEDPALVVALVQGALRSSEPPAEAVPPEPVRLPAPDAARFDAALAVARQANFVWWNEDHNAVIDLRAHLPIRRAALAIGAATGAPFPEAALYLYDGELADLLAGGTDWSGLTGPAEARRELVLAWRTRRGELPGRIGWAPDADDPVMRQIMGGAPPHLLRPGPPVTLVGLGVSAGVARGRVRVVASAVDLDRVQVGEVLVCEATSPSWTSVFDRVAACICDAGGMLTHAAIISREYAVPCVCATGAATTTLHTGDLVEVDGTAGTVVLLPTPALRPTPRAGPPREGSDATEGWGPSAPAP